MSMRARGGTLRAVPLVWHEGARTVRCVVAATGSARHWIARAESGLWGGVRQVLEYARREQWGGAPSRLGVPASEGPRCPRRHRQDSAVSCAGPDRNCDHGLVVGGDSTHKEAGPRRRGADGDDVGPGAWGGAQERWRCGDLLDVCPCGDRGGLPPSIIVYRRSSRRSVVVIVYCQTSMSGVVVRRQGCAPVRWCRVRCPRRVVVLP